jgi:plasmid stabilization system protein ParE
VLLEGTVEVVKNGSTEVLATFTAPTVLGEISLLTERFTCCNANSNMARKHPNVTWSEHATEALLEALRTSHAASVDESRAFAAAVAAAVDSLAAAPRAGRSLPEMGDPSILEVPVATARIQYRLIYDVQDVTVRT